MIALRKYWLLLLLLTGCAQLGLTPPQTFEQKLAYGYAQVGGVRVSAANALSTGVITVADAKQVQTLADEARAALDASKLASSTGDTTTALGKLTLANGILTQLAAYLNSRGVH
jgi:hypothetical protein